METTKAASGWTAGKNGPFIHDHNVVEELGEGRRTLPELGVTLELNMIDGRRLDVGTVEHVFSRW